MVSRARPADAASSSHGRSLFRFSAAPTRVRFFILCPEVFFLCLVKSRLARDGLSAELLSWLVLVNCASDYSPSELRKCQQELDNLLVSYRPLALLAF